MQGARSVHRRFLALSVPNILANLLVPLASLVDVALLGHLAEVRDLAGTALAIVIFDYVLWGFGFLRMATTGLTAQARGRGDEDEVRVVAARGLVLAAGIGIVLLAAQAPLRDASFALLQGGADLEAAARGYYDARIWGAPFTLANYVWLGWLLGCERSRLALGLSAVAQVTNIVLDVAFIGGLGLGAAGAGAATAASQLATFVCGVLVTRGTVRWRTLGHLRARVLDSAALRAFGRLGVDITVRTLLLVSAFAIFTSIAATLGTAVLAATAVLRQVVMLAAWFVDGFAFAVESLAGIFAGAGDRASMRATLRLAFVWSVGVSAVIACVVVAAPRATLGLLTDHADVIALATDHVAWLVPVLLLGAPAYVLDGYFLGVTAGGVLRRAMAWSALLGFAPLAALAARTHDAHLLWAALATFMFARTWTLGRALRARWQDFGASAR